MEGYRGLIPWLRGELLRWEGNKRRSMGGCFYVNRPDTVKHTILIYFKHLSSLATQETKFKVGHKMQIFQMV